MDYFDAERVAPNDSGVLCPDNQATIRINARAAAAGGGKPVHASKFEIKRTVPGTVSIAQTIQCATYRIGQSPHQETCVDLVIAGLESGAGLYQFVPEQSDPSSQSRATSGVIQLLLDKQQQNGNRPLRLGNRFTVESFTPETPAPGFGDCLRYRLTVTDRSAPGRRITVPITEAGLPFQQAVLTAGSIERASTMLDQHQSVLATRPDEPASAPLMLCRSGYGRNAALMTYRDVCLRIAEGTVTTEHHIAQQVRTFIEQQRLIRPGFVHSLEQVAQIEMALRTKLARVAAGTVPSATLPSGPGAITLQRLTAARPVSNSPAASRLTAMASRIDATGLDIADMAVDGIAIGRGAHTFNPVFKQQLNNTLARHSSASNAVFLPIKRRPTKKTTRLPVAATQPGYVQVVHGRNSTLPEEAVRHVDQTLADAAAAGLRSVGFEASLLEPKNRFISFEQIAALAVATAQRWAFAPRHPVSVTFQATDPAKKVIIDNVIVQWRRLNDHQRHQYHQALLRGTISQPTSISTDPLTAFADPSQLASFVPVAVKTRPDGTFSVSPASTLPERVSRSEIPLASWKGVPATRSAWESGDVVFPNEPDRKNVRAAGVVIVEDDGRIWAVAPTNRFAGMNNTFPKGQIDFDELTGEPWSLQATARKEAYEESGLQVELTDFLHDYVDSGNAKTRYYLAKRIGGSPADVGWESQAVHLAPAHHLRDLLNQPENRREHAVLRTLEAYAVPA